MSIDRDIKYRVVVDGAPAAASALKSVDTAADGAAGGTAKLGTSATAAATGLTKMETSAKSAASGVGGVENALEKITGPTGKALRVLNDVGDVFRLMGAGLAGGVLFGGLQDIAEAMTALADKAGITKLRVDALVEAGGVLSADLVQRSLGIDSAADAMDRYAKSIGQASAAMLTFAEEQAGLAKVQTGELLTRAGVRKGAEQSQEGLADVRGRIARADRFGFSGAAAKFRREEQDLMAQVAAAKSEELELLGRKGANPFRESLEEMGREIAKGVTGGAKNIAATVGAEYERQTKLKPSRGGGRPDRHGPLTNGGGLYPTMPGEDTQQDEYDYWMRGDAKRMAAQAAADDALVRDQRNAMMAGHATPQDDQAMAQAEELERALARVAEQAAEAGAKGRQMGEDMGRGLSTAAAAALYTGASFTEAANLMMQGLAIQAGGEAIWETAQGVAQTARYISSYGLDAAAAASAAEHFGAAALFASISVGAAVGTALTGGFGRGGGSAGGAGDGGRSGGGGGGMRDHGGGRDGGDTHVTVMIGEDVVANAVHRRERDARMRGGMARSSAA